MPLRFQKVCRLIAKTTVVLLFFMVTGKAGLSPALQRMVTDLDRVDPDSLINIVVFLEDRLAREAVSQVSRSPFLKRDLRIKSVVSKLKSYSPPGGNRVRVFLEKNSSTEIVQHWIVPAYTATILHSKLQSLATLDGVKLVIENSPVIYEKPVDIVQAPSLSASVSNGLALLSIPYLWSRGLTGKGRLVCSFDTGVEQSHPALASKWRGNYVPLSAAWFSKVTPDTLPSDNAGHGTHTMGLMVGAGVADTFGVAPDAQWISAGVIDQGRPLGTTISDILEAYEWALDPDGNPNTTDDVPDVILNSWGIPKGLFAPCDGTFYTAIDNVEAASVVCIFAAGNEGPDPRTMRYPADRASTPINSFAVGAIDNNKVIAGFSSRGPSSCDAGQIKPELVAPGISIRSSYKGGGYMYMSGTSMAAPYIAGLVALMRQYNPDATVEEIKNALIQSCSDLGPTGEDNAYGFGLPDASKLLDYISPPMMPQFSIAGMTISDDGIAAPGEQFDLQMLLLAQFGSVEIVNAIIVPTSNDSILIMQDQSTFYFGDNGTTALNTSLFQILFDSAFHHGREMPFTMILSTLSGMVLDTLYFTIMVGIAPQGNIVTHSTTQIDVSVSDFGQFGFAPGSIYNLQGEGFRYNGGENLLYEAGIILGRNSLQLSSAVRDSSGLFKPSDFVPLEPLTSGWVDDNGCFHRRATLVDSQSEIPIPVTVTQHTTSYPYFDDNGLLIVRYILRNESIEKLTNLYFGFLADFDLLGSREFITYDQTMNLIFQESDSGPSAGIVTLKNITSFRALSNGSGKSGFSRAELFDLISSDGVDVDSSVAGDMLFFVGSEPFTIQPRDSVEVAFALVAGDDIASVYANAAAAKERYDLITDVDENETMPLSFDLYQNYPNPFNPTTSISFSLQDGGKVILDVFNVLGQKVKTLLRGQLPTGEHTIEWDATDDRDKKVASGVYFYRLTSEKRSQTRKMVLLK